MHRVKENSLQEYTREQTNDKTDHRRFRLLKSSLLQPDIARSLGAAGHGAQVLIADGNYPASTHVAPHAARVYLNLTPGTVTATDVLRVIATAIPIESAHVMQPADGSEPPIFGEFRQILGAEPALQPLERFAFYAQASQPETCLVVATGEQRIYANILLTIGVVKPG
jgi:L-fucose mutarotase